MYHNSLQRSNPGLIIFLLDQSASMSNPMSNGFPLDVNAADAINSVVNELMLRLVAIDKNGDDFVKRSAFVSVIGYGGKGDGTGNQFDYEAETIIDGWIDELAERPYGKSLLDGITELVQVVTPVHGGGTPMASAFGAAKELVEAWIQTHNTANDPVPVIINITDGEPTDSITDLKNTVNAIKALKIPDGAPLIFNIHLTSKANVTPIKYPSDIAECTDDESRLLFELSSDADASLIYAFPELQAKGLQCGAKLFMSNVFQSLELIEFFQIGTVNRMRYSVNF